jgi:hypothetical protein
MATIAPSSTLRDAAAAAASRGLRFDAPVESHGKWTVVARGNTSSDPNAKPERFVGTGPDEDHACQALIEKLPPLGATSAAHCPTCTCTG